MHHSQLEYLIAVRKLQDESAGVRGITLADYMNVSASYICEIICICGNKRICLSMQFQNDAPYRARRENRNGIPDRRAIYGELFSLLRGRQRHKPQRCNQRRVCNYRKGEECVAFGAEHKSTNRLNFL